MGVETKFRGSQVFIEDADKDNPKALKMELQEDYHQKPREIEVYEAIKQLVQQGKFVEAKQTVAGLLKAYMEANKGLSPELKALIAADWYKQTSLEKESKQESQDAQETKVYNNTPVIVVGRNLPKRILNVAWGRGQEGFFKWNFRSPLPEYNDLFSLSFEQKQERGMMAVRSAQPLEEDPNFQEDFYRIEQTRLSRNEDGLWLYEGATIAPYLFANQAIQELTEEDEVSIHLIYKYLPREKAFAWTIAKLYLPNHLQVQDQVQQEEQNPKEEEEREAQSTDAVETLPAETVELQIEEEEPKPTNLESHTLIINDIPLRNGELTCRCITNKNEMIYFRKSLTQMELNRLDKLVITGLVREENYGKQFVRIEQIKLAKDEDFPETILRKRVKRLHKEDNNIFLDDEQMASRKVQLLRLKHLLMKENSSDLEVEVEEMYLYAVHIKDYEWTISNVRALKAKEESAETKATSMDKALSPDEQKKAEQAMRQPWQIRVGYITKVNRERGRVELIYGVRKKGYISLNDFPLDSPYEGDWLGMKMLDGNEPMHEIVFNDIIRLDPNKRLPNTSKLIHKVRRGMLWYSEQDHIFKLHNAPISQELVLAMENPQYKDYFLVEEILDYNVQTKEFAWRPIKVEKFEYLESIDELEGHIFPMKHRQKVLFDKALANLQALNTISLPIAKEEKIKEVQPEKEEKQATIQANAKVPTVLLRSRSMKDALRGMQRETAIVRHCSVSFCPQRISKRRNVLRGKKGLSAKRKG